VVLQLALERALVSALVLGAARVASLQALELGPHRCFDVQRAKAP
jgi:hypothetical protein